MERVYLIKENNEGLEAIPEEGEVNGELKVPKKKKKPKKEKKKGDNPMSDLMGAEGTKAELGRIISKLTNRGEIAESIVPSIPGECATEENGREER
jgi:hypothetical protein